MKFFVTEVKEIDRHIEPIYKDQTAHKLHFEPKYEIINLSILLMGSGDTREFATEELLAIVMDKLAEIKPE